MAYLTVSEELKRKLEYTLEDLRKAYDKNKIPEWLDRVLEIKRVQSWSPYEGKWYTLGYILVVATGGPHIEVNTVEKKIEGWLGGEHCEISLPDYLADAINDYLDEIFYE